jgi:hypothetical protein
MSALRSLARVGIIPERPNLNGIAGQVRNFDPLLTVPATPAPLSYDANG